MACRHCNSSKIFDFVDLGSAPPSNAFLTNSELKTQEAWFPLKVFTCLDCWLVQTEDYVLPKDIFEEDNVYFSSVSRSWLDHAKSYVDAMVERFDLDEGSMVIEVAANDGYLLQYVREHQIPCLGIEPSKKTAAAAIDQGIEIVRGFFGAELAEELAAKGHTADLMPANNVLAHVPDINDFAAGFARLLKPDGIATFEFQHLMNIVAENQFDTIYHEHFSYLSLTAVASVLGTAGLVIFHVEEIPTHGGSLRVYAGRADGKKRDVSPTVAALLEREHTVGVTSPDYYANFQPRAEKAKDDFLRFLLDSKQKNKRVAAYGAAAKGNTFLNFAGIRRDLVPFVVDANPNKQGRFMPGSRIPIVDESRLRSEKPDFVVILPWNLRGELGEQLAYIREWGGQLVTAIPELDVW